MSLEHLSTGSTCPPLVPNKLRIYAMRFCPYSQRVLLTAVAKGLDIDIVFINLKNKPEWLFDKNQGGKVPSIEIEEGKVLTESTVVSEYLDEAHSAWTNGGRRLVANTPYLKAVDRILIEGFCKLATAFYKLIFNLDTPPEDIPNLLEEVEGVVTQYSKELEKRGTKFFDGAEAPGMLDYMIWPWFERRPVIPLQHPSFNHSTYRKDCAAIETWVSEMKADPAVKTWFLSPEIHHAYNQTVRSGSPDFNMLMRM